MHTTVALEWHPYHDNNDNARRQLAIGMSCLATDLLMKRISTTRGIARLRKKAIMGTEKNSGLPYNAMRATTACSLDATALV